jgi:HAD superfamily hydrolase (TIGR01509 family)
VALDAAIFDMDGLLVDSEPVWHEVEVAVFRSHGVPLTVEGCLETKGMFLGEAVDHWYERYPWRGASRAEVARQITDAMAARLELGVDLKPGAAHALHFCERRGARLALASSSPRRLIDAVVHGLDLARRFAVVHSAEAEDAGKPHPAVFLTTAALLGVAPAACVVFEDSPAGVVAAKAAGMVCVAVPEPWPSGAARGPETHAALGVTGARADAVLSSLEELDDRLWRALGGAPVRSRRRGD